MPPRRASRVLIAALVLLAAGFPTMRGAAAATVTVVEFYNATLDHYFISPLQDDIDALDSGRTPGWNRTGYNFTAYGSSADFAGASPVCRYYIPPQHGDSHFFSASPDECAAVATRVQTDPNYSGYILETASAFSAPLPDLATGACPAGFAPVFRLWNQRADSNHRYTADPAIRAQMIARGYVSEGYGPLGVAWCTPSAILGNARITVSGPSPYAPGCDAAAVTGVAFTNAEVEPQMAVNPQNPMNLIGVWQQDRWSNGGARGLRTGYSLDGGRTWAFSQAAFSRCSGGNAVNGADYARASDPWVSIGPAGIVYQIAISFNGGTFQAGSSNAVLVSRSLDGGATWSVPTTLISDGAAAFNDKESITADSTNGNLAYAVWDRLLPNGNGPTWLARTTDGGATWEPSRMVYDPGTNAQTINNQVAVLPDGTLLLFFTRLTTVNGVTSATLNVARSVDKGLTFGAPIFVAASTSIGTRDPQTGRNIRDAGNIGSIAVGRNGTVAIVWQDARFSDGTIEGVAFSRSLDGGRTWSVPVQVNRRPDAQALLPVVAVRDDGTYGVLYYDLRNDTLDASTLRTDVWLAQSVDGTTWTESHVSGPFDLNFAPLVTEGNELGLFVGDYQALGISGSTFLPFFVQTNADVNNRTDVFASILSPPPTAAAKRAEAYSARPSPDRAPTPVWQASVQRNLERLMARRRVGLAEPGAR